MPEVQIIKASERKVNRRTGKIIQKLKMKRTEFQRMIKDAKNGLMI